MISVRLQGKPFSITVIQVCALTNNAEEAKVEQFFEDLQDLLELTPKKDLYICERNKYFTIAVVIIFNITTKLFS